MFPVLSYVFHLYRTPNQHDLFHIDASESRIGRHLKIPSSLKSSFTVSKNSYKHLFVDIAEKFAESLSLVDKLTVKEIAINLEFDSKYLFYNCTTLIQFSSYNFNVIIDPFKVFKLIRQNFDKIM